MALHRGPLAVLPLRGNRESGLQMVGFFHGQAPFFFGVPHGTRFFSCRCATWHTLIYPQVYHGVHLRFFVKVFHWHTLFYAAPSFLLRAKR